MVVVSGSAVHEPFRSSKTGEFMHGVRKPPYNCAVARSDIGVPTCELVDANVAVCGIRVSSNRLNFTSVIAKSVASNLRRRSVFRSLCLAQVFILRAEHPGFGQEKRIADDS